MGLLLENHFILPFDAVIAPAYRPGPEKVKCPSVSIVQWTVCIRRDLGSQGL